MYGCMNVWVYECVGTCVWVYECRGYVYGDLCMGIWVYESMCMGLWRHQCVKHGCIGVCGYGIRRKYEYMEACGFGCMVE